MLINQIHNDSGEDIEFDTGQDMTPIVSDLEIRSKAGDKNLMLLKDWIDNGQMEKQMFAMKENAAMSSLTDVKNPIDGSSSSTMDDFIFPEEKVCNYA